MGWRCAASKNEHHEELHRPVGQLNFIQMKLGGQEADGQIRFYKIQFGCTQKPICCVFNGKPNPTVHEDPNFHRARTRLIDLVASERPSADSPSEELPLHEPTQPSGHGLARAC